METIIPSVYRAYLEEYIIVFEGLEKPLYNIKDENGDMVGQYTLGEESFLSKENQAEFIRAILYRDFDTNESDFLNKFSVTINLNDCKSLYEQLQNKTDITEHLGEYYKDDNPNIPDVNKTKKRIITYKVN